MRHSNNKPCMKRKKSQTRSPITKKIDVKDETSYILNSLHDNKMHDDVVDISLKCCYCMVTTIRKVRRYNSDISNATWDSNEQRIESPTVKQTNIIDSDDNKHSLVR